jgi:hypothetical protein
MNVELQINTQFLRATQAECNDTLFQHTMQNISFACGGDTVNRLIFIFSSEIKIMELELFIQ